MERDPALQKAIDRIGGFTAVANALGIKPPSVFQWQKAPYHWVRRLHDLSGVPLHELAPDMYDAPEPATDNERRG